MKTENFSGPEASLIQPRGKIELGNPVLMQMLSGQGEYQPVLQVLIYNLFHNLFNCITLYITALILF